MKSLLDLDLDLDLDISQIIRMHNKQITICEITKFTNVNAEKTGSCEKSLTLWKSLKKVLKSAEKFEKSVKKFEKV